MNIGLTVCLFLGDFLDVEAPAAAVSVDDFAALLLVDSWWVSAWGRAYLS